MKKRLLIALVLGFAFTPSVFASGFCSYDHSYGQDECAAGAWVDGGSDSSQLAVQPSSTNWTCLKAGPAEADDSYKGGSSYPVNGGGGGRGSFSGIAGQ